jgi:hypothetical protein
LPSSVERALADALSLEHPDVAWTPPPSMPSAADLKRAIEVLAIPPAEPKHMAWCLAKLTVAFEAGGKLSAEETKLRAAIWAETNADLGNELWSEATMAALRSLKWMPKPSEFRTLVDHKLAERSKRLYRCEQMLAALRATNKPKPAATTLLRPEEQLRALRKERDEKRAAGEMHGAAWCERSLALRERRLIEQWARDYFDQHGWAPTAHRDQTAVAIEGAKSAFQALKDAGFLKPESRFGEEPGPDACRAVFAAWQRGPDGVLQPPPEPEAEPC